MNDKIKPSQQTQDSENKTPTPNEVVNPETGLAPCPTALEIVALLDVCKGVVIGAKHAANRHELAALNCLDDRIDKFIHRVQGSGQKELLDVIEFARGAIIDACYHEDGLDEKDGSAVIRMINNELLKHGRTPTPLDENYKRKSAKPETLSPQTSSAPSEQTTFKCFTVTPPPHSHVDSETWKAGDSWQHALDMVEASLEAQFNLDIPWNEISTTIKCTTFTQEQFDELEPL